MLQTAQLGEDELAFEKANLGKLDRVVNDAITAISTKTGLSVNEAREIMANLRVEMVGEIRGVIDTLGNLNAVKHADAAKLSGAIEDAIESIANATDLVTDEITEIFTQEAGASIEDVVSRLYAKSKADRSLLSDRLGPEADRSRIVL